MSNVPVFDKLKKIDKKHSPCLRIMFVFDISTILFLANTKFSHVQNALWAREVLFKRYGIISGHKDSSAFSRWAQYEKPQRRAGHPILNARAFRVDKNVWRRVWSTGFGVDYLRYFTPRYMELADEASAKEFKVMQLNEWVETDGNFYPAHAYDVYVQRLSVYVQRNMEDSGLAEDEWQDYPDSDAFSESVRNIGDARNARPPSDVLQYCDNSEN
jgi:hypothetical protein